MLKLERPIYLYLDNLIVHHSKKAKLFCANRWILSQQRRRYLMKPKDAKIITAISRPDQSVSSTQMLQSNGIKNCSGAVLGICAIQQDKSEPIQDDAVKKWVNYFSMMLKWNCGFLQTDSRQLYFWVKFWAEKVCISDVRSKFLYGISKTGDNCLEWETWLS